MKFPGTIPDGRLTDATCHPRLDTSPEFSSFFGRNRECARVADDSAEAIAASRPFRLRTSHHRVPRKTARLVRDRRGRSAAAICRDTQPSRPRRGPDTSDRRSREMPAPGGWFPCTCHRPRSGFPESGLVGCSREAYPRERGHLAEGAPIACQQKIYLAPSTSDLLSQYRFRAAQRRKFRSRRDARDELAPTRDWTATVRIA